jgi:hypothetical protein
MDWLIVIALLPLVLCLIVSGWLATGVFVLWIACLMAAVLLACIVFLLIERAAFYIERGFTWLKNSLR